MRKKQDARTHLVLRFDVTRQAGPEADSYVQSIVYETDDPDENVASALRKINGDGSYRDVQGRPVGEIAWESGCLQKRCGACAMVIDGRPALACATLLRSHRGKRPMTLEPLSKFPVIADLRVDRQPMLDDLRTFGMWLDGPARQDERRAATAYEASRCIQCGCCLEVCPNFVPGGPFFGAAGFVPASRLLASLSDGDLARTRASYLEHAYEGCAKSLACQDVCPAEIDIEDLLARSSAAVLYRRQR